MRKDKQERHKVLCGLIGQTIETEGQEAQGFVWAVRPRAEWADMIGVDTKTIARLIMVPPIVRLSTAADDGGQFRRVTALRIGQAGEVPKPLPSNELASKMANLFRAKTGRGVSRKEFGCLCGLAGAWPDGWQVQVFKYALSDWPSMMAALKLSEALLHDDPDHQGRFYRYPSIPVLRRFANAAADAFLTEWQTGGKGTVPFPYACK